MNQSIKTDVLLLLNRAIAILQKKDIRDILELRTLSDQTLHNASIFQDHDSISIGVLMYALSKIFERKVDEKNYNKIFKKIVEARDSLRKDDIDNYRMCVKDLFVTIKNIDYRMKMYIQEVIDKAKIQKGSKLFAHGISMARVSDMLGITRWELMNYIGKTQIVDWEPPGTPIKQRLKLVRSLFP